MWESPRFFPHDHFHPNLVHKGFDASPPCWQQSLSLSVSLIEVLVNRPDAKSGRFVASPEGPEVRARSEADAFQTTLIGTDLQLVNSPCICMRVYRRLSPTHITLPTQRDPETHSACHVEMELTLQPCSPSSWGRGYVAVVEASLGCSLFHTRGAICEARHYFPSLWT